nr:protein mnn4 [Quercus suber]
MRPRFTGFISCILASALPWMLFTQAAASSFSYIAERDADFESVGTNSLRDHSDNDLDKPNKYFHESKISSHYDGRFVEKPLPYSIRQAHLKALIRTYLWCMKDIGVETFIMHGTLLGWWWNRKIMPWDTDVDVVVTETSLHHMAAYYNMTVHHYKPHGLESDRSYLLEVNINYSNSSQDPDNHVDARWIDTDTGLFIDITTIRHDKPAEGQGPNGMLMIKDNHHYVYDDIFPLRDSIFEGCIVKIPFAYPEILAVYIVHPCVSIALDAIHTSSCIEFFLYCRAGRRL